MRFTRREFLRAGIGGAILAASGLYLWRRFARPSWLEKTFIAQVSSYQADIAASILAGLRELGMSPEEIKGKRILLKPNLVQANPGSIHINTHPLVVRGAAEAFLKSGASQVLPPSVERCANNAPSGPCFPVPARYRQKMSPPIPHIAGCVTACITGRCRGCRKVSGTCWTAISTMTRSCLAA